MPRGATVPLEGRIRAEGGQIRVVEGVGQNLLEDENVRAIVVTMRDTTSRRELEQQLERRAFQDELTGLANRALFVDRLEHALEPRGSREGNPKLAVLFIDLDDFKAVNDGMGHAAGRRADPRRRRAHPQLRAARRHGRPPRRRRVHRARRGHPVREPRHLARAAAPRGPAAADRRERRQPRRPGERRRQLRDDATAPPSRCSATPTSRCTARSRRARAA